MPSYLVSAKEAFVPTQMYTPPIQSIGEILRIKQGRYDQGYNQVNSVYRSILDSEVLSADGTAKKKQYLDNAETALKQLSQMDLSQPENVKFGEDIFKPFWQDQDMVREIGLIKTTRGNIAKGESLQMNADEKLRADYNPFSIKDLNNQLKEISESTADERKMMTPRNYVKKVDLSKEMDAALTNLGVKNGSLVQSVDGTGYKITNQFGKESVLPLIDFFNASLSTDARDYIQMMGRLQYRDVYEGKLVETQGDKQAARDLIAKDIVNLDKRNYEQQLIPELDRAKEDAENKIAGIIATRKSENSDLSEEDMAMIENYKKAVGNYKEKADKYRTQAKNLGDPNSEYYKEQIGMYSSRGQNVFGNQVTNQYANAWARSRANVMGSIGIDEDKTWKNQQDLIMEAAKMQNQLTIAEMNNATKEDIAAMKAAKGKGTTKGANGEDLGPIYVGQTGANKLINKSEQFAQATKQIYNWMMLPTIQLFEKTLADRTGVTSATTQKIFTALSEGKGSTPLFTAQDVKNNSPEYAAFKKILNDEKLSGVKPGTKFSWTYDQAFEVLSNSVQSYIRTDEGKANLKNTGIQDILHIDKAGDIFKAIKADQQKISNEIFADKKYSGYTINESGVNRLKTNEELAKDYTIAVNDENGQSMYLKLSDIVANKDSINTTSDLGLFNYPYAVNMTGSGGNARTYTTSMEINGKKYTYTSGDPRLMDGIKKEGATGALKVYQGPEYKKMVKLREEYNKDFERIAPNLKINSSGNADAFNFGAVEYRFGSKDNTQEDGERALAQLFGPENITMRRDKFIGIDKKDLEDDSVFMDVVKKVTAYLPELAGKDQSAAIRVEGYNNEIGAPVYKPLLSEGQILDALQISKSDLTTDMKEAISKFQNNLKIAAPTFLDKPGNLINGLTPFESYVRANGYKSGKLFDDLNVGNFEIKKMTGGGYRVNASVYEYNPKTKKRELVPFQNGMAIELPEDVDVTAAVQNMYNIMQRSYVANNAATVANPPVPKGQGTSVSSVEEELKKQGIIK